MAARAFIVRPFGQKKDGKGIEIDFDAVQADLIDPALKAIDVRGDTTIEIANAGNIREDMFELLVEADLVIADISIHNANVFYELGVRHALRDRRTYMIRCRADDTPFDLATDRYLEYDRTSPADTLPALIEGLRQTMNVDRKDSPVFRLVPGLVPQDPTTLIVVPQSFGEEVDRRARDGQPGDLDMLADELKTFKPRWVQQGLRVIGLAQFAAKRWESAKHTWEGIQKVNQNDIQANVKLATVYAKLGDRTGSDQAIQRALDAKPNDEILAELYALRGSNEKTAWGLEWEDAGDDAKQRALVSPFLNRSYEAYREGFLLELNHYYSGINALTLLTIRLSLAHELPEDWIDGFDTEEEADRMRKKLGESQEELRRGVKLSVEAARAKAKRAGVVDPWLETTMADLACISGDRPGRVARLYNSGAGDSQSTTTRLGGSPITVSRTTISTYRDQVQAARKVVREKMAGMANVVIAPESKPPKVLVFTGHRIDAADRAKPRFPAAAESIARSMIEEAVDAEIKTADGDVIAIAGAASGGDILFHEVCEQRNLETRVLLAGPRAEYIQASVQDGGPDWVARFDALLERKVTGTTLIYLGPNLSLPRWLEGVEGYSIWQRNNLWTLHNAMTISGAARTVLIAHCGMDKPVTDQVEHRIWLIRQKYGVRARSFSPPNGC